MPFSINYIIKAIDQFTPTARKVKQSLDNTTKAVTKFSDKMERVGGKLTRIGKSLSLKVSAPIAGAGAIAVRTASHFEKSMNVLSELTGATGKDLDIFVKKARELGVVTQFSSQEAIDAMIDLRKANLGNREILEAIIPVTKLAAAANISLGDSAITVAKMMRGYRLQTKDLTFVTDVMAKTASTANVDIKQLAQGMAFFAPIAKGLKIPITETTALFAELAQENIFGRKAASLLRMAYGYLIKPVGDAQKVIQEGHLQLKKSNGELKSMADIIDELKAKQITATGIYKLFGETAGPIMKDLVDKGSGSLRKFSNELTKSGGYADRLAKVNLKGLSGSFINFGNAVEQAQLSLITPEVRKGFTDWINNTSKLIGNFAKLNPETMKWISRLMLLLAVLGPIVYSLGKFVLIMKWIGAFKAIGAIFSGIGAALKFMLSPVGLIIAALILLAVGFYFLYKKSALFRKIIKDILAVLKTALWPFKLIYDIITGIGKGIGSIVSGMARGGKVVVEHRLGAAAWTPLVKPTAMKHDVKSTLDINVRDRGGAIDRMYATTAGAVNILNLGPNMWSSR